MVRYIMSRICFDCSVKSLGLAVRLWFVCRRREVFNSRVAANGCDEFANKLITFVCMQVRLDLERDYEMLKKQVRTTLCVLFRLHYCSCKF